MNIDKINSFSWKVFNPMFLFIHEFMAIYPGKVTNAAWKYEIFL